MPFLGGICRFVFTHDVKHKEMASWLHNCLQERSDNVKSLMALPNTGLNRPPRSPTIIKSIVLTDSEAHTHSGELCSSAQGPQQLQQAVRQVGGGRFGSTAEREQHPPGSSGRQDGASNGSSESSELENREMLKRPSQKKGAPVLRHVQSKCANKYMSLGSLLWLSQYAQVQLSVTVAIQQLASFT